jgi:hypothetical protein
MSDTTNYSMVISQLPSHPKASRSSPIIINAGTRVDLSGSIKRSYSATSRLVADYRIKCCHWTLDASIANLDDSESIASLGGSKGTQHYPIKYAAFVIILGDAHLWIPRAFGWYYESVQRSQTLSRFM